MSLNAPVQEERVNGGNDPLNQLTASFLLLGWPFGSLVCKMSGMVQGISVSASVFTLVAIAVDRYSGWICTNTAASCNTTLPFPCTSYTLLKMSQRDIAPPPLFIGKNNGEVTIGADGQCILKTLAAGVEMAPCTNTVGMSVLHPLNSWFSVRHSKRTCRIVIPFGIIPDWCLALNKLKLLMKMAKTYRYIWYWSWFKQLWWNGEIYIKMTIFLRESLS